MARKEHKHIYNSSRWQRTRALKLRTNPLCEYCVSHKKLATEVDHKKAISDGGDPWAWDNLASACKSCHSKKTANNERLSGCDEQGMPLDPNHTWNQ